MRFLLILSLSALAASLLTLAACGEGAAVADGLWVEQPDRSLGSLQSGEVREIRFPFEVRGAAVRVLGFEESCGCSDSHLLVGGEMVPVGSELGAGSRGEVVVSWRTAGFQGFKQSTLKLVGEGPGLPLELKFSAELQPFFRAQPDKLLLDGLSGAEEEVFEIVVRADVPFRLLDILASLPPWKVRGLPSSAAALEQRIELVLPPGVGEIGRHQGFLQIRTDQELPFTLPISYELIPELWTRPSRRLLFGPLDPARSHTARLEVGVQRGHLAVPVVHSEGIDGLEVHVVTLEDAKRYQVQAILPAGLAAGPIAGKIRLRLVHTVDGAETPVEREIQVLGVVQGS